MRFNHFISLTINHNVELSCYFILRKGETLLVFIARRCLVVLTCIIPISPPFRSDACIHLCVGIYHSCIWSPRTTQVHVWSVLANASNIAPTINMQILHHNTSFQRSSLGWVQRKTTMLTKEEENKHDKVM